ncbi:putative transmembrane protein [Marinobacterium lacunae]|uniref:Putative transmembrane protein n=1 Tax=Marinobacterium lacunae TaxID=1232683 RepID=A0A081FT55_9GAMM|nr:membrane protein [Marinobacterium lacunae]KEA61710.1 putative transmembrane protein [Marinobacterium lacunae]MBR9883115.1 hypothetical protein [Oceanospirillales bacterium]
MTEITSQAGNDTSNAKLIYILYLASLVVGITGLIGLVMAYINKSGNNSIADSHYRFQIRTFWIGLLMAVIGGITLMFVVGWFILLFLTIWMIIRCVKGLKYLSEGKAHPDPASWMFG